MTEAKRESVEGAHRAVCENDGVRASLLVRDGVCTLEVRDKAMGASQSLGVASPASAGGAALVAIREEEDAAEAIAGGIVPGTAFSWEFRAKVLEASAAAEAQCRILNRFPMPLNVEPSLSLRLPARGERVPGGVVASGESAWLAIAFDERSVRLKTEGEELEVTVRAASDCPYLFPHRIRVHRFVVFLVPQEAGEVVAMSERAVVTRNEAEGKLRVFVGKDEPAGKAFLQLANGETVEAPLHAYAAKPAVYTTSGLGGPPVRILLRDEEGETILDAPFGTVEEAEGNSLLEPRDWEQVRIQIWGALARATAGEIERAEHDLLRLANEPACESIAWFLLGAMAMRRHQWERATAYFDESLLYGGANPIAWVFRAWCVRQLGGDPAQELANAHLLAPVDPLLRFDAFLEGGGEGLLDEFGADPEPYLDAADLLWLAGREAERNVVLAAAAERAPSKLVHRLRSDALKRTGHDVEAEAELQRAEKAPGESSGVRITEQLLINS
ncbi:MAG: hypothetical protein D6724_05985 [Armatimonadetes bacterium]|nr:MAG: hypothetical protein D6724_05985 [Armatimonadota bacterium]